MATVEAAIHKPVARNDFSEFWVIYAISFLLFLLIALPGQLFGWHWRSWLPGAEGVDSLFGGVKAAVYTFMSHVL